MCIQSTLHKSVYMCINTHQHIYMCVLFEQTFIFFGRMIANVFILYLIKHNSYSFKIPLYIKIMAYHVSVNFKSVL